MELYSNILENNKCLKCDGAYTMKVKGIFLHSVGCAQPKASVFMKMWNDPTLTIGVHGIIDGLTGAVYQCLRWDMPGWHAGDGDPIASPTCVGNKYYIGVEMCEPAEIKYTTGGKFTVTNLAKAKETATKTYNAAVELFAMLCRTYGLNALNTDVIMSHSEGHKKGIASNHGDPEHLWKGLGLPYDMNKFRSDVYAKMCAENKKSTGEVYRVRKSWNDTKTHLGTFLVLDDAVHCQKNNPSFNVYNKSGVKVYPNYIYTKVNYVIKTTAPNGVSIYTGPDENLKANKTTGRGAFTVIEECNGFGRLKSGAGWVMLSKVTKL